MSTRIAKTLVEWNHYYNGTIEQGGEGVMNPCAESESIAESQKHRAYV